MKKNAKKNYEFGKVSKKFNNDFRASKGYFIPEEYQMLEFPTNDDKNIIPLNSKEECENFYEFTTSGFVKGWILNEYDENGTTQFDKLLSILPWMDWSKKVDFQVMHEKFGIEAKTYSMVSLYGDCNTEHPLVQDWLKVFDKKNFFGPNNTTL